MRLIRITPNEGGAYPPIQEAGGGAVPEGMAVWPEGLSAEGFYACGGFATVSFSHLTLPTSFRGVVFWGGGGVERWRLR